LLKSELHISGHFYFYMPSTIKNIVNKSSFRKSQNENLKKKDFFYESLISWWKINGRHFAWRPANSPFQQLLAEILLQRSRAKTVEPVFIHLIDIWPSPHKLANAKLSDIEEVIRPLGLIKRAKTIQSIAREISKLNNFPQKLEILQELPGVGRYAATATIVNAYDANLPIVDTVTARVYTRYFNMPKKARVIDEKFWQNVKRKLPKQHIRETYWAILDLAAMICLPKRPKCIDCPLAEHCKYILA
jgi:A/G-specific adenine glycosylase